ncbi:hypothetical protein OG782_37185 (plasmid) [Streptomyces sp. NBC_00876]|uniref:hypothetical protein n=1 Tax=Streptomyces sp. NBC_00876 TaxID=2975853 RepID=UPI00386DD025|nr:hypothetical protein OG782_37185 [Streptomyces sp. NBC_00876]
MSVTHTAVLLLVIGLAVIFSCLVAGIAFGVARWGGAPAPESLARSGKAFATSLTVLSALIAVIVAVVK